MKRLVDGDHHFEYISDAKATLLDFGTPGVETFVCYSISLLCAAYEGRILQGEDVGVGSDDQRVCCWGLDV